MAGHSKWANIKHRKAGQDAKKAKIFNKLAREIEVAAKFGPDPDANPRLRGAISAARGQNMTNDRIQNAIKKGSGQAGEGVNYDEIRYEGYASGGVALIVECLTDNRNRTAAEVRTAFTKHGGNMGETGSVSFMFDKVGQIIYPADKGSADDVFEAALEAGAEECESDEFMHEITCAPDNFNEVRDALQTTLGDAETAHLTWKAQNLVAVDKEQAEKIMKVVDTLEDNDDVQQVCGNYDIPDEVAEQLE